MDAYELIETLKLLFDASNNAMECRIKEISEEVEEEFDKNILIEDCRRNYMFMRCAIAIEVLQKALELLNE